MTTGPRASGARTGAPDDRWPRLRPAVALICAAGLLAACSSAAAVSPTSAPSATATVASTSAPPTTTPPPSGDAARPATVADPAANLPDPFVLTVPGGYQLYASQTGIGDQVVPTAFSPTFGHWPRTHSAIASVPGWATNGFVWAPDVVHLDGEYVMYFDSIAQPSLYFDSNGSGFSQYAQCIGIATATAPGGPFVGKSRPLVCDFAAHGAIDPRTFLAPGGRLYLDWKSDDNAAAPAPYSVTHIYAQLLRSDGLSFAGPPHLLLTADERWQERIVEAPDMVEVSGKFWLFYSGAWFNGPDYGVGYASCAGPAGPCVDRSTTGPLVGSNSQGQGPGEESLFEDPKGQWWMLYSPWFYGYDGKANRPIALAAMGFGAHPYVAATPSET